MSQDTRKDPRAKIVSLNVRYKSATVDEFIDNHSHDVSRGGLFIKTSTPFAQGTLLKFEIRLSSDQPVIAGVGRVVWKREPGQAGSDRPAGMGVKFIKIDDKSRTLIERLVTTKSDAGASFQENTDEEVTKLHPSTPPVKPMELPSLRPTNSGMPAVTDTPGPSVTPAAGRPPSNPAAALMTTPSVSSVVPNPAALGPTPSVVPRPSAPSIPNAGFFPATNGEEDMPPPQERTMMRQAAELLEEALKASGGSMEEVGQNPLFAGMPGATPAPRPVETKREAETDAGGGAGATIGGFPASSPGTAALSDNISGKVGTGTLVGMSAMAPTPEAPATVETPARRSVPPAPLETPRRSSSAPPAAGRVPSQPPRTSSRPVRATDLIAESAPKKSGGGLLWASLALIVIGGGVAYAYQYGLLNEMAGKQPPAPTTSVTQTAPPATSIAAAPASASATAAVSAIASASAAPVASASAAPIASASAAASPSAAVALKPADKPTPTPPPVTPRPTPRPKPVDKPSDTEPGTAKPSDSDSKPADTKPADTKADKPTDTDTPTPPPAPKKPPKKPKDDSDNPY